MVQILSTTSCKGFWKIPPTEVGGFEFLHSRYRAVVLTPWREAGVLR